MKETIKKSLVGWLVFLWTVLLGWLAYAWIVWQVSDGQTLTAEMWNNMTGNYDYSTEEVNTWKKWIDGKPIYRKVVQSSFWSNTDQRVNDVVISNEIDKIVDVENMTHDSNGRFSWVFGMHSNDAGRYYLLRIDLDNKTAYWIPYDPIFVNQPWTMTVEYTKTTD